MNIELSERQNDGLTELVNIAFGRTAASLSELTGRRVILEVPRVRLLPAAELQDALRQVLPDDIVCVNQVFNGPMSGNALLLIEEASALHLCKMLTPADAPVQSGDAWFAETLTELGNIMLKSWLGMFGNLLRVHVSFTLPRLRLESLNALIASMVVDSTELRYGLVVLTRFRLTDGSVSGYLVMVLGVSSVELVLQELDKYG